MYPTASLLITGHSLGAALATFAAVDIKEQLSPSQKIYFYTFGSPRTGNQAFSDHIMSLYPSGSEYYRVVHAQDIVPHLPMTQFGFNHAGNEVWYPNAGTQLEHQICLNKKASPENLNCADTVPISNYSNACHMIYVGIDFNLGWCGGASTTPTAFLA
jgi:hypothetical protein